MITPCSPSFFWRSMSNPASKAKEGLRRHSVSRFNRALDLSGGAFAEVSDLQAEELLEETAMHLAVAGGTHHSEREESQSTNCCLLRDTRLPVFTFQALSARATLSWLLHRSHHHKPCRCKTSKKRMLHNRPSAISSRDPSPHPSVYSSHLRSKPV